MGKIAQIFFFKIKKEFLNFIDFCGLQKSRSLNRTYVRKIHKGLMGINPQESAIVKKPNLKNSFFFFFKIQSLSILGIQR